MEKMGNMANDGLIRRPFQPHRPSPSWQKVGPGGTRAAPPDSNF